MFKVVALIDGLSLHRSARSLGFVCDFKKLKEWLGKVCVPGANLVRVHYYTPLEDSDQHSDLRPLVDWLDYNGFSVFEKYFVRRENGTIPFVSILPELYTDALMYTHTSISHFVLFVGDSDYAPLINALKSRGASVIVVSSLKDSNAPVADVLRRSSDSFVDLLDIANLISRPRQQSSE